jgi:two-component system sensor histidine kinase QseC
MIVALCGISALVVGIVMLFVARYIMRPVHQLSRQIAARGPEELASILPDSDLPAELRPMVDRLNNLLLRVGEAFNRERTFTADVAHELRTPLAGMRTMLEVSQSRIREPAAYQASVDQCVAILGQMEGLVERLLLLARAEGGQLEVQHSSVNLETLALECWMSFERRAGEQRLTFSVETQEDHAVIADAQLLQIVLKNLMDNAVSYAEPGTRVRLAVRTEGESIRTQLISEGHALTEDDLRHVFNRFWRKDKSRSRTDRHVGLGLGLSERLTKLQGGELTIRVDGRSFVADILLPAAGAPHDEPAHLPVN